MNRLQLCFKTIANVKCVNYEGTRYIKRWVRPTLVELTKRKKETPQPVAKRSDFIEWNRGAELYAFNQRLSEKFDSDKLNQAFVHKSYIIEETKRQTEMDIKEPTLDIQHNEEFINKGKEITSQAIKKYVKQNLPRIDEAGVVAFHDYLMSNEILAKASLHIGTKDIILTSEHPVTEETLAQTFLSLVGALAESVNIDHAASFVRDFLIAGLANKDLTEIYCPSQPFEVLNEIISNDKKTSIEARLIGQAGPKTILSAYHIGIYADKEFLGSGFGQTIAEAKDVAAINILADMWGLLYSSPSLRFDKEINMSA